MRKRLCKDSAQNRKAVFFDIDGTLAAVKTHLIPDSTRKAIEKLHENRIPVILCTGRHPLEVEEENILPGLTFDGAVWVNGQFCELGGKCISQNCFSREQMITLKDFLTAHNRSCIFLEKDAMYCNMADERLVKSQAMIGTAVPPVRGIERVEDKEIIQAVPFIDASEEAELLKLMPDCKMTRWGEAVVDFMPEGGGKERGICAVCEALGIRREDTVAFGDGENDVDMLRFAGIGIAMGNAVTEAKEAADHVTDPIDEDGVWNALVRFGLI